MHRRNFLAIASASLLTQTMPATASSLPKQRESAMNTQPNSGYASVNGLELYYEIHGTGEPLVMLHGGIAASEAFGENLPLLAQSRQVIAVHLQGHGNTRDIDRPLRYELMADDVAGLIRHLGLEKADVMGYSFGAGVAMQAAIRHPQLMRRLIVVSEPMSRDGYYPEVLAAFDRMQEMAPQFGAGVGQSPMAELYPHIDWVKLFTKMGELTSRDYDWSEDVANLETPTMLVFADADAQTPEHIVKFWRLLGGGQRDAGLDGSQRPAARLAIVPGATHYNLFGTTAVAELVLPFLEADPPETR